MKKVYLMAEPEQKLFLVFASKREGYDKNIILKIEVRSIMVYKDKTVYFAKVIGSPTGEDISKYKTGVRFTNANINTGYRMEQQGYCPVFTTKDRCLQWLKG